MKDLFLGCLSLPLIALLAWAETPPPPQIEVPEGFMVERIYQVPRKTQGSWVSLAVAPDGTIIVSDQYDKGIFRVTPSKIGDGEKGTVVEKEPTGISNAWGMCVAFDALYVMRCGKGNGLWRVTDSDGDGRFDKPEQLFALTGASEHGPHAVLPDLDGKSLLINGGNITNLPSGITHHGVPPVWKEDLLLPRQPDGRGHNRGRLAYRPRLGPSRHVQSEEEIET